MAIKTSKSSESYFSRYKQSGLYATNRKRRLERVARQQPNNAQIPLAIKSLTSYRRRTPKEAYWSHQMIETAKLYKLFVGVFDKGVFSQKPEDQEAARRVRNINLFDNKSKVVVQKKQISDFSLAARAHDGRGNLVWA